MSLLSGRMPSTWVVSVLPLPSLMHFGKRSTCEYVPNTHSTAVLEFIFVIKAILVVSSFYGIVYYVIRVIAAFPIIFTNMSLVYIKKDNETISTSVLSFLEWLPAIAILCTEADGHTNIHYQAAASRLPQIRSYMYDILREAEAASGVQLRRLHVVLGLRYGAHAGLRVV